MSPRTTNPAPKAAGESPGFEAALARLDEIVAALEQGELELGAALALFEEGVALLRLAEGVLGGAEARVLQLVGAGEQATLHPLATEP